MWLVKLVILKSLQSENIPINASFTKQMEQKSYLPCLRIKVAHQCAANICNIGAVMQTLDLDSGQFLTLDFKDCKHEPRTVGLFKTWTFDSPGLWTLNIGLHKTTVSGLSKSRDCCFTDLQIFRPQTMSAPRHFGPKPSRPQSLRPQSPRPHRHFGP